MHLMRV